jgi:hypothetical protein
MLLLNRKKKKKKKIWCLSFDSFHFLFLLKKLLLIDFLCLPHLKKKIIDFFFLCYFQRISVLDFCFGVWSLIFEESLI